MSVPTAKFLQDEAVGPNAAMNHATNTSSLTKRFSSHGYIPRNSDTNDENIPSMETVPTERAIAADSKVSRSGTSLETTQKFAKPSDRHAAWLLFHVQKMVDDLNRGMAELEKEVREQGDDSVDIEMTRIGRILGSGRVLLFDIFHARSAEIIHGRLEALSKMADIECGEIAGKKLSSEAVAIIRQAAVEMKKYDEAFLFFHEWNMHFEQVIKEKYEKAAKNDADKCYSVWLAVRLIEDHKYMRSIKQSNVSRRPITDEAVIESAKDLPVYIRLLERYYYAILKLPPDMLDYLYEIREGALEKKMEWNLDRDDPSYAKYLEGEAEIEYVRRVVRGDAEAVKKAQTAIHMDSQSVDRYADEKPFDPNETSKRYATGRKEINRDVTHLNENEKNLVMSVPTAKFLQDEAVGPNAVMNHATNTSGLTNRFSSHGYTPSNSGANNESIPSEMSKLHIIDSVYKNIAEGRFGPEKCAIKIWSGYAGLGQKGLLTQIKKWSNGQVSFENDMEELVEFACRAENLNNHTVTILPRQKELLTTNQARRLKKAGASVIYINTDKDIGANDLGQLQGIIGIGKAYIYDDEDAFYELYNLLAKEPTSNHIALEDLKNNPIKFIRRLNFYIKPIVPQDSADRERLERCQEALLRAA
jgi:hypothetical protein